LKNNDNIFDIGLQGSSSNGALWLNYSDFNGYKKEMSLDIENSSNSININVRGFYLLQS
jgi:hypothetical protein